MNFEMNLNVISSSLNETRVRLSSGRESDLPGVPQSMPAVVPLRGTPRRCATEYIRVQKSHLKFP